MTDFNRARFVVRVEDSCATPPPTLSNASALAHRIAEWDGPVGGQAC